MSVKFADYGVGLLRTHVPWEDIQKDIQKIFGDSAKFGEHKTVTSIGDGKGFMSKMCLIEPDWVSKPLMAPEKFIVKVCTQIQSREMFDAMVAMKGGDNPFDNEMMVEIFGASTRKMHNTEVNLYEKMKTHNMDIPRPKIYYTTLFTEENPNKGYLIMEFIEGAVDMKIYDNIEVEDLKQPLRALAVLESASLKFSDEEKASFKMNPLLDLMAPTFSQEMVDQTLKTFRDFGGARLEERIEKMGKVLPDLMNFNYYNDIGKELGMTPVLCHGDLWSSNLIWTKKEGESMKMAALLDFQIGHFGLPAIDLCRLMNASMSGKNRQENWEKIIQIFYGYLEEEMKGETMPYTYEQLLESVRRFIPLAVFLIIPIIGLLLTMNEMNPDLEEKARVLELALEKSECLLDDMLKMNERNLSIKKENGAANGVEH